MGRVEVDVVRRGAREPRPHEEALVLPPPNAVEDADGTTAELERFVGWVRAAADGRPTVADLFCGAGGLSLGLEAAGFRTIAGVDLDDWAIRTHASHFPGLNLSWDLHDELAVRSLGDVLRRAEVDVIVGGPPCQPFSRAGRSLVRKLVEEGRRNEVDERRDLWEAFLEVALLATPRAVLMENVPGLATEQDMQILRLIVDRLELAGYGVSTRVVSSNDLGVPQHRTRLILVGLHDGSHYAFPDPARDPLPDEPSRPEHWLDNPTLWQAIGDLPPVPGGWAVDGVHDEDGATQHPGSGPESEDSRLIQYLREGVEDPSVVHDHYTRAVRDDDAEIFSSMDHDTRYDEIDEDLRRYRDDIFTDKYKRLAKHEPSRTITAHMAKDGYWYIHPSQDRTLTVREAARLQTFPDRFRFAGPPTAMFRQIGNAVPPLLGERLGVRLRHHLGQKRQPAIPTRQLSRSLADWWQDGAGQDVAGWDAIALPDRRAWLRGSPWQSLVGELLIAPERTCRPFHEWPLDEARLGSPKAFLHFVQMQLPSMPHQPLAAAEHLGTCTAVAAAAVDDPSVMTDWDRLRDLGVPAAALEVLRRAHPRPGDDPVIATSATTRMALRATGAGATTRGVNARIAVARLVGVSDPDPDPVGYEAAEVDPEISPEDVTAAHLGLLVAATSLCNPGAKRLCAPCPLSPVCPSSLADYQLDLSTEDAA